MPDISRKFFSGSRICIKKSGEGLTVSGFNSQ